MPLISNRILVTAALSAIITGLVLAVVLLVIGGDDNAPIQVVLPTPEAGEGGPSGGAADAGRGDDVTIYLSGAVRNPGVYGLRQGQRLADALAAAGGATAKADLDAVNLALRVQDEEQYHIPRAGETPRAEVSIPGGAAPDAEAFCGDRMDLNLAPPAQLDKLPGIGPARAAAIVVYREENGPFESVEQITEISGIGPATFEKLRDLVAVCN